MNQELTIEKLVFGGDGLARLPADAEGRRLTAFVPWTLPNERILARVPKAKSGFARANLLKILEPSTERVEPRCKHFGTCGGCQWQHASYTLQLQSKVAILQETFARAGIEVPAEIKTIAADPWQYRHRVRLHVQREPEWRVGYHARRTNDVLHIDECPISAPIIERAISALNNRELNQYAPKNVTEIELFAEGDNLLLTAFSAEPDKATSNLDKWSASLREEVPELAGIALISEDNRTAASQTGETLAHAQVLGTKLQISAGAFFQANRYLIEPLAQAILAAVPPDAKLVWDLYAGVGLFAAPLTSRGHRVIAVEGAPISAKDLATNLANTNAEAIKADVSDFLTRNHEETPDCVIVDPPRTGLEKRNAEALVRIQPETIVYLACDPVTLARDLQPLLTGGYTIESCTLIDLFPQTFHLETLITLRRV